MATCYNLGKYLNEAIDSVFAQTFQDFEILIVDDGSTDADTIQLLSDYRRPKTRVVRIENRGLSGARNEGVRQTTGSYVCCLDADDRLAPNYLERSVAVLDAEPEIAFVSHWLETFGDESYVWKPDSAGFPALLDMNSINGAALVRREALLKVGLFDETMRRGCEDWDLWIGMVERGMPGVILPEVLFHYRRRHESMSRVMMEGSTPVELYRYLIEKHRASFENHLLDLVMRRERDRVRLLAEAHDLELDCAGLSTELERAREDLRVAQHKTDALENREAARRRHLGDVAPSKEERVHALEVDYGREGTVIAGLREELTASERRRDEVGDRLARAEEELLRNREGIEGLKFEIRMLRGSLSWRLTRPLRAVYSRFFE